MCKECGIMYSLNPKKRSYPEELRLQALKIYYSGVSGRGVGKALGMSKGNVYNWIKKTSTPKTMVNSCYELDELYWFIERKPQTKTKENVYIITMVSRTPRQIVGYDVAYDRRPERIQAMVVDAAPYAEQYSSDGYNGYTNVIYPGAYTQNTRDKSDTYTVEGVNADLRHYIPILARRSRCFARSIETLQAVMEVFVDAYNRFGVAKHIYRQTHPSSDPTFSLLDFL